MCPPKVLAGLTEPTSRRNFLKLGFGAAAAAGAAAIAAPAPRTTLAQAVGGVSFNNVQDLTHVLGRNTPLFPGSPPVEITPFVTIENNGYYGNIVSYWEHVGTHMDAPAHFAPGGAYVDQLDPASLVVPIALIDISARAALNPDTMVSLDDILAYEAQYGTIRENSAVFMNSGWADRWGEPTAFVNLDEGGTQHYPGFSQEATDFLVVQRNIAGIGVDTLSLDPGNSSTFDVHVTYLGTGRWGVENLANLNQIPPAGAVAFVGAPKLASGSGGPTRVMAIW